MDLDELRAFLAVAETGSFSAAARSLNSARETLRKRVDAFEAQSGVELLKRAADGAKVTRAGEILAEKCRSIVKETWGVFEAVMALDSQKDLLLIELPVGLPPSVEQFAHRTLRKAAPSLRFRIRYTSGQFNAQSDATFILHSGLHSADDGWYHTRIARVGTGLMASESYLKKQGEPHNLDELKQHPLIVWERHDRDPQVLPCTSVAEGCAIEPVFISPSAHLVRKFAAAEDGIALLPTSRWVKLFGDHEPLVRVLPDLVADEFEIWMAVRSDANGGAIGVLAQAMARFIKTLIVPPASQK